MRNFWDWFAQLSCAAIAVLSLRVVLVERARSLDTPMPKWVADEAQTPPKADLPVPSQTRKARAQGKQSDITWGVAYRLADHLGEAEISVPALDEIRVRNLLHGHWRKMHSPFVGPSGNVGRLVQQIGLTAPTAAPVAKDKSSDGRWHADPRLWGLDEGTYDQREAILAPAPARLSWQVNLPENSRFETAPAAFDGDAEVEFEVAVIAFGTRQVVGHRKVSQSRVWNEWRIDLSQFHGAVSIELTTRATRDTPLAAWGSPMVLAPSANHLPYNTVFIVVDAMRGDALSAMHDAAEDAAINSAQSPPFDAWLPRMPEVAPNLDRLAANGVTFARAWTAAMWTRPATLAMLSGMRPHKLGLPVLELEPRPDEVRGFYQKAPPLWPLLMRAQGVLTRAIINNMYLCGYVGVGVDTGFEAMTDHRFQVKDTDRITEDTLTWLKEHRDERFALFINYVSPHSPYVPEPRFLQPIEDATTRPDNKQVRRYLAEIRKDDAAIGRVLDQLEQLGLTSKTAVVVTADHGETMSQAHDWIAVDVAKGVPSGRFTHLSTMWDEAARVPLLISLPGRIPENRRLVDDVQTTDIVPTLLDILGLKSSVEMDGMSLLPALDGKKLPVRPVVVEGRGAASIRDGQWRLIDRSPVARHLRKGDSEFEKAVELYNMRDDPGERRDLSATNKEIVLRLQAELAQQLASKGLVAASKAETSSGTLRLRIATSGHIANVRGSLKLVGEGKLSVTAEGANATIAATGPNEFNVSVQSKPDAAVGFNLTLEPADADLDWKWWIDGTDWPKNAIFAGPLGVMAPKFAHGFRGASSDELVASDIPYISESRETRSEEHTSESRHRV
jgi:arylsulfatase A-like enzyme